MYKSADREPESWRVTSDEVAPRKVAYGVDSPVGAIISFPLTPLYLYASLKGKFDFWDRVLEDLPDTAFVGPTLDAGCGSGMVLIKTAQQSLRRRTGSIAYGIDIFDVRDQSGNSPQHTLNNVAVEGVGQSVVLQRGSFVDLPYANESFSLVTSSLAIHNPKSREDRVKSIRELCRVLKPDGQILILDLAGSGTTSLYADTMQECGMRDVDKKFAGAGVMFGVWYCSLVQGVKAK